MPHHANDFLKDYQAFAQQSWDGWVRHLQQQAGAAAPATPFASMSSADDLLTRSLAGLSGYANWLQGAAQGGLGQQPDQWQQQLQSFFGNFGQPFTQTFSGIDSAAAQGFGQQWQAWLQAAQQNGLMGMSAPMAPLGYTREQQLQQQAMSAAMVEYLETNKRYNEILQKVSVQGMARLQDKLAEHSEPGRQVESMKALYDLWVDAMEEAYAEAALSDEFRDAYGAMVNAQMRVRKLQQAQTEQLCRELGMPTRSEVDSLGKRLQELRREWRIRAFEEPASGDNAKTVADLEAEVAKLKRELAARKSPSPVAVNASARKSSSAHSKPATSAAPKAKAAQATPRKRK